MKLMGNYLKYECYSNLDHTSINGLTLSCLEHPKPPDNSDDISKTKQNLENIWKGIVHQKVIGILL